jgi:multiple sugar transport system ATP-binding protein
MTMATRIVVMKDGLIQQVDTPQNLYDFPLNKFVAGFIGTPEMNFLGANAPCTLTKTGEDYYINFAGHNKIKLPEKKVVPELKDYVDKEIVVGIRPEAVYEDERVARYPESTIDAVVEVTELMGSEIYLYVSTVIPEVANDKFSVLEDQEKITARVPATSKARSGDHIKIALNPNKLHIFDKETEKCIVH